MVTSSARTFRLAALLGVLVSASLGHANCDPTVDPDKSDIANARAAVAANCNCATASTHGAFVGCADTQGKAALTNKSCAESLKRCASRSTCGKPGFVTCCRTRRSGSTRCALKRTDARCVAPPGGSACVGSF